MDPVLVLLGLVGEEHVEDGREDEVEDGDGGGADQVEDGGEVRQRDAEHQQTSHHQRAEQHAPGAELWRLDLPTFHSSFTYMIVIVNLLGGILNNSSKNCDGGLRRMGKEVIKWMRKRISTATLTGPSQRESMTLSPTLSPRRPQLVAEIVM